VLRRPQLVTLRIVALLRLWALLRRRRPALVWLGSSVAVPIMLVACRAAGVRAIVHVHEDPAMTRGHGLRIALVRALAHGVVFVGKRPAQPFRPQPRRQRWVVLANPMDAPTELGDDERHRLRQSLGAAAADVVFICAAFLNPRKDHDTLLRAFAKACEQRANSRLWVVGGEVAGHEGCRAQLEALAAELGIQSRVTVTGLREDVPALMQAADVCVLASRQEAMPLSIAEAQLAGRPVVATRVGDVPTMVRDGLSGYLFKPGDADAMAEAMARLAADADLRRDFGHAGRLHAAQLYAAEALMPQFEALIRRVSGA
jgi:glycosyltransferase involved in cell wall biosynthesis